MTNKTKNILIIISIMLGADRLYDNISKAELTIPTEMDYLLSDLVKSMLCKEPDERISIQQIKQHE